MKCLEAPLPAIHHVDVRKIKLMNIDWQKSLSEIEDVLIPHFAFDIYKRGMYLFLLTQTRVRDLETVTIPLSQISAALSCSDWQSRKTIRELAEIGCIDLNQTRQGHQVRVLLPSELNIPASDEAEPMLDLEEVDFFRNREFLSSLIARESGACFYCLSEISEENCELDHVVSQLNGCNNGYRNIVASCHKCNTRKQAQDAEDFLRSHFRKGLLNETEFEERLASLKALQKGELKPEI